MKFLVLPQYLNPILAKGNTGDTVGNNAGSLPHSLFARLIVIPYSFVSFYELGK